jgi:hypothetical protein
VAGGFESLSNDAWGDAGLDAEDEYLRWGVGAALPYKLTSNFTIIPTIIYSNYGDKVFYAQGAEEEAGDEWLVGVHFQVLF